jgi:CubicO group peptidase (beta-lactamase class C family)
VEWVTPEGPSPSPAGPPRGAPGGPGPESPCLRAALAQLESELPRILLDAGAPWATVAVRFRTEIATWTWNAPEPPPGADPDPGVPVGITPGTVVRWASLAKPVTALLVLRLAALGRLGLDDPAVAHSASFEPSSAQLGGRPADSITIRHLLTHTSGMGVVGYPPLGWRKRRPSAAHLLSNDGPHPWALLHAPGQGLTYGSAAYLWLQSIVEDISGTPFESAARQLLLRPLGLPRVALLGDGPAPKPIAWGVDDAGRPIKPRRSPAPGATGMFACPADIARLFGGLVDPRGPLHDLLGENLVTAMTTNQTPGLPETWGLGWRLQAGDDGPVFRHAGWPDGVLAYTEGIPSLGLLTCLEIGRARARRALVRIADIARWHARASDTLSRR